MYERLRYYFPSVGDKDFIPIENTAEAHNGIYRGKNLTDYFDSGEMSTDIAAGTFKDIFIGDYIIKTINLPAITYTDKAGAEQTQNAQTFTNVKWYIAGIDSHLKTGNPWTTAHHVVLISASALQVNVPMNPTNDTTGGYLGSDMWRVHMPNWANAIKTAFGDAHVLKHREALANAINATIASAAGNSNVGATSSTTWTDVEVNIPSEYMVCGAPICSSSWLDAGEWSAQLPLFAHKPYAAGDDGSWFWLRTVASASRFTFVAGMGGSGIIDASSATIYGGIRPYFLLY